MPVKEKHRKVVYLTSFKGDLVGLLRIRLGGYSAAILGVRKTMSSVR
jgi:hypothetical protein